jgi:hypothetical protein
VQSPGHGRTFENCTSF